MGVRNFFVLGAVMASLISTSAFAELNSQDQHALEMAKKLQAEIKQPGDVGIINPVDTPEVQMELNAIKNLMTKNASSSADYLELSKDFGFELTKKQAGQLASPKEQQTCKTYKNRDGYYIFVSRSMPENILKTIMEQAAIKGIPLLVRGVMKGEEVNAAVMHWKKLAEDINKKGLPTPTVLIEPNIYKEFGVDEVPAIARVEKGKFAMAYGVATKGYIDELIEQSGFKDYGIQGDTYKIHEADFVEDLKERASKVDWNKKSKQAVNRYWQNQQGFEFPVAFEDKTYWVDLTVTVNDDVVAKNNIYIAKKGERFNPLANIRMTKKYLIFNPSDQRQLEKVEEILSKGDSKPYQLIVTKLSKENGWKQLGFLMRKFNSKIFVMSDLIKNRFNIRKVPSVVEQDGEYLRVKQVAVQ